jgi:uncharacterized protein with NRDE domain
MCLLTFNWGNHPTYKLVLVANRDEYFSRPSQPIHLWEEGFYAGKDLKAGGTWLGIHPSGKFAFLTNYRDFTQKKESKLTRGNLVKEYLSSSQSPVDYLEALQKIKGEFDGFNLVVGDRHQLLFLSNYQEEIQVLSPNLYGLSNALLDTPWHKVTLAKKQLQTFLDANSNNPQMLMQAVHSRVMAEDHLLPDTGVGYAMEKKLSRQFITIDDYYGTVNSTVLLWKHTGEVILVERTFQELQTRYFDTSLEFEIKPI